MTELLHRLDRVYELRQSAHLLMNATAKKTWGKRESVYFKCLLILACIGLLVATFYWRKMASSLRAENRDLLESLESLRQANATDHEV
ncbi:MAG: hypothetical protein JWM16_2962, partial [Verrucomicrobiales bacterium]|nr:hypothetical protein [Verrucomicrobiales bacterium]